MPRTSRRCSDAILYAIDKGAFVAAAAGNSGDAGSPPSSGPRPTRPQSTGCCGGRRRLQLQSRPRTRTATTTSRSRRRAGPRRRRRRRRLPAMACCRKPRPRPGRPRASSISSGTSSSRARRWPTPHVSGLAALLMTQGVKDAKGSRGGHRTLRRPMSAPPGRDNDTGFGVINPRNTLRGLGVSR